MTRTLWHAAPAWLRAVTLYAPAVACATHATTAPNGATFAAAALALGAAALTTKETP